MEKRSIWRISRFDKVVILTKSVIVALNVEQTVCSYRNSTKIVLIINWFWSLSIKEKISCSLGTLAVKTKKK